MEACRIIAISNEEEAKAVITNGLFSIPHSVKLWMRAANLEHDDSNKSRVLRKGLERITNFIVLCNAVVELTTKSNEKDLILLL